jgi:hypothetical protein
MVIARAMPTLVVARSWSGMTLPNDDLVAWLLEGDPSIRWRVHRDLLGSSEATVRAERASVANEGWGAKLLSLGRRGLLAEVDLDDVHAAPPVVAWTAAG